MAEGISGLDRMSEEELYKKVQAGGYDKKVPSIEDENKFDEEQPNVNTDGSPILGEADDVKGNRKDINPDGTLVVDDVEDVKGNRKDIGPDGFVEKDSVVEIDGNLKTKEELDGSLEDDFSKAA